MLAACQTTPAPAPQSVELPAAVVAIAETAQQASAPLPVAALTDAPLRRALDGIRQLLDQGQDEAASIALDKVLASNPGSKAALTLRRSMRDDPLLVHGREAFAYTVVSGDTLAAMAQRFLNDRDLFWSLARYNGIKAPRQLVAGQTIRVPGKRRSEAPAALSAAVIAAAPVAAAAEGDEEADAVRADLERKEAVDQSSRQARTAMARRDVCTALAAWDQVLRYEPFNREALQQREKTLALKPRSPSAHC